MWTVVWHPSLPPSVPRGWVCTPLMRRGGSAPCPGSPGWLVAELGFEPDPQDSSLRLGCVVEVLAAGGWGRHSSSGRGPVLSLPCGAVDALFPTQTTRAGWSNFIFISYFYFPVGSF